MSWSTSQRIAQQPGRRRSRPFRPDQRPRHAAAPRGGSSHRRRSLPPRVDVRGLRGLAARLRRRVLEESPYRPAPRRTTPRRLRPTTTSGRTTRRMSSRSRSRTARTTTGRSSSGEGDPALRHERARRQAAADVRVHAPTRVAARPRSAARSTSSSSQIGSVRPTTSARGSRSRSRIADVVVEETRARPEADRPRPAGWLAATSSTRPSSSASWLKPEIGFDEGLRETVEWYADNRCGGSRSRNGSRSKKPPGVNNHARCQAPDRSFLRATSRSNVVPQSRSLSS